MEKSASEPVLKSEDYFVPCNGIGATGHAKRVLYGHTEKDSGKYSSRINQIIKQAEKVPGPGKYVAHGDWPMEKTHRFCKSERQYKPMNKTPAPPTYERKDFFQFPSNGAKDNLSNHYRVLHGKVPKGKKRSFTDQAIYQGKQSPGPGAYTPNSQDVPPKMMTSWAREASKTKSLKQKVDSLAPNHYKIDYSRTEPSSTNHSVPKEAGKNFIDKFVKEKWSDARTKKELPGPGTYNTHDFNLDKTSRGTYHLQLRGLTRSSMSGYF